MKLTDKDWIAYGGFGQIQECAEERLKRSLWQDCIAVVVIVVVLVALAALF